MRKFPVLRTVFVGLALMVPPLALDASAGTLILDEGVILGINNVELGAAVYDVEFVDGTCIDLFSGCDGAEDFPFSDSRDAQNPQSAIAAALAIEAILHPPGVGILGRAAGCDPLASSCEIMTISFVDGSAAHASITFPDPGLLGTTPLLQFVDPIEDLSNAPFKVYARWTLIPEPSVALLLGLGLCGLHSVTGRSRPRRKRASAAATATLQLATTASGQSYFSTTTGTEGKAI